MDVVWLVLDSLGFTHTSLRPGGPETSPRLAALASERGVIFDDAWAAGPASPSSHAAFLTGELPTRTGMHEAHPFFDGRVSTVADRLGDTHTTYLTTVNPFLFNGLDESFDVADDLAAGQYTLFEGGVDPRRFGNRTDAAPGLPRMLAFLREAVAVGTPLRSTINAARFKLWQRRGNDFIPNELDGETGTYRYASVVNDRVRNYLANDGDAFVLANYMDVHPPLNASDEAVERFVSPERRDGLPVGVRAEDTDDYEYDAMVDLYRASIWDLDRAVTPLVEELVDGGAAVIVTADHGPRFGDDPFLGDDRLHVPLVVFAPDETARRVAHTVSLRSLARTTVELVRGIDGGFDGSDLLAVDEDRTAIAEHVHSSDGTTPVDARAAGDDVEYDLFLKRGAAVLREVAGTRETEGPEDALDDLASMAADLRESVAGDDREHDGVEYDPATEERLRDLGYL